MSTQFGSGYYVNKDLYASTEYRIEKSFIDVYEIKDHTQQDGVTFFDQTDCSGPSGTVNFNDRFLSRDPSTLQADRTELNNIPLESYASVYVPVGYELLLDGESYKSTEYLNEVGM